MKTNGTRAMYCLVLILLTLSVQAQPDYVFKNSTLVSGTDKQINAKYLFKNVKTGVDCFVTITDLSGVTLAQFDGPDGYAEAFQPYITCPGKTKGYAEFQFDFVKAGTTTPKVMTEIPVTAIDIDGYVNPDEKVFEYDEFLLQTGYYIDYDLIGTSLTIKSSAKTVQAINKTAVDYPGIDTVKRDVMFTMVYSNVSSITIRAGVNNKSSTSIDRLRSDYFQKFSFANSFLAKPALLSFQGSDYNNKVALQWQLDGENSLNSVIIEKATVAGHFQSIGQIPASGQTAFRYTDNADLTNTAYYRLRMVSASGAEQYSNTLVFRPSGAQAASFKAYPTVIQNSTTLSIKAGTAGTALFRLADLSGRIVLEQSITLQQGDNNVVIGNMGRIMTGSYVALVSLKDNTIYSQKVFKQ